MVHDLVQAQKCLAPGQSFSFTPKDEHGQELAAQLELVDGGAYHLRLVVMAARNHQPESYEASLLLNNRRVRGVGFSKLERKKFFKTYIPKGWHENVHDYLLPVSDERFNWHEPLLDFAVTDLQDFLQQVCVRWNIRIDFNENLW